MNMYVRCDILSKGIRNIEQTILQGFQSSEKIRGKPEVESLTMQEETQTEPVYIPEEHPWLENTDGTIDEVIRYSLDELRFG